MTAPHVPVLLSEVLDYLQPANGETYIDGTFGAGGYTRAILDAADCTVVAIDRDPAALEIGRAEVGRRGGRLTLVPGRFSKLDEAVATPVHGVVLDIGVSSMQLDDATRGFSFRYDGPLDMRMGQAGLSAADIVNRADEKTLAQIFSAFGEERFARGIARRIVARRADAPFKTTRDLSGLIEDMAPRRKPGEIHPATRVFQALRIAVNRELEELALGLEAAERALAEGGRLVVVAFHSLEDRIVKQFLRDAGETVSGSRHQPAVHVEPARFTTLTRKAVTAGEAEIAANPRARSAKLRAGRRTGAAARPAGDAVWRLARPAGLADRLDFLEAHP